MGLISLVYVSLAADDMTDDDLKVILETARRFNGDNDITGMLLYRDGFFIQALEGEEKTVAALYEKIKRDKRHVNVIEVIRDSVADRSFEKWSMGFNKITTEEADMVPGLNDFLQNKHDMTYFTAHPSRASRLLEVFKDRVLF